MLIESHSKNFLKNLQKGIDSALRAGFMMGIEGGCAYARILVT